MERSKSKLKYIFSAFYVVLALPCGQASEEKDEQKDKEEVQWQEWKKSVIKTKEEVTQNVKTLLNTLERFKPFQTRAKVLKKFLREHESQKATYLKILLERNYENKREDIAGVYMLLASFLEHTPSFKNDEIDLLTFLLEKLTAAAYNERIRQERFNSFNSFVYCVGHTLTNESYGPSFRNHQNYMAFCKRAVGKIVENDQLVRCIARSHQGKCMGYLAQYVCTADKHKKILLPLLLEEVLRNTTDPKNFELFCHLFQQIHFFKELLFYPKKRNEEEKKFLSEVLPTIEGTVKEAFHLYKERPSRSLGLKKLFYNAIFLTFCEVINGDDFKKDAWLGGLYKLAPKMAIETSQASYRLFFQEWYCQKCKQKKCKHAKMSIIKALKKVVLCSEAPLTADKAKERDYAFHSFLMLLSDKDLQELIDEGVYCKITFNRKGEMQIQATPTPMKSIEELKKPWETKTHGLSFKRQMKVLQFQCEKGLKSEKKKGYTIEKLEKCFDKAEESTITAPLYKSFLFLFSGLFREGGVPAGVVRNMSPMVKSYCFDCVKYRNDIEELTPHKFWKLMHTYTTIYDKASVGVGSVVFGRIVKFPYAALELYPFMPGASCEIAELGATAFVHALKGNKGEKVQQQALAAFSKWDEEERNWQPTDGFILTLPMYNKALASALYGAWAYYIQEHAAAPLQYFIPGIALASKYPHILKESPNAHPQVFKAFAKMAKAPQTKAYIFTYFDKVYHALAPQYRKKCSAIYLQCANTMVEEGGQAMALLSELIRYALEVSDVLKCCFALMMSASDLKKDLGRDFLGDWLEEQENEALFIEGLIKEEKVNAFLAICKEKRMEISNKPYGDRFFSVEKKLQEATKLGN